MKSSSLGGKVLSISCGFIKFQISGEMWLIDPMYPSHIMKHIFSYFWKVKRKEAISCKGQGDDKHFIS